MAFNFATSWPILCIERHRCSLMDKKKCRLYSSEYLRFGFTASPANEHLPMCSLYNKVFSKDSMKPSKLTLRFTRCHADKNTRDVSYLRALREKQDRDGLAVSYKISLLIAKTGKPHTIGEELLIAAIA
uniref:Uncharacterized protein n=1 Tax=Trichuris muris TaxID=70415 RepID=A0A5S6Q7M5_TRIMR